jgi:sugar-specific transcriptional regulator TrmB
MEKNITIIKKHLSKLGIDPEATGIYIELTKNGASSALQLAKSSGISRTQIYRYLESLQSIGLVSAEKLNYGTYFRALPLENIEAIVANREAENAAIKHNLSSMSQVLQQLAGANGSKATIQHYYGLAGLKQVNWNLTKAKKEYRVFEAAHLSQHLDKAFAKRCRERCIENGLVSYDLTNSSDIRASDIEPYEPSRTHYRHIDSKILTINFEVYIYNDVVTLLDYSEDQQLALEIHHPSLQAMMQQLFDAMWSTAKPLEIRH